MQILFTGQRSADSVIKVRVQGLTVFIYKGKRLSQSSTTQKKVTELTVYHVKYPCKELHVIFHVKLRVKFSFISWENLHEAQLLVDNIYLALSFNFSS